MITIFKYILIFGFSFLIICDVKDIVTGILASIVSGIGFSHMIDDLFKDKQESVK